jgi:hypothetical protein
MKFYSSLLLPKRQKIALLRLRVSQLFVSFCYAIETHILKTSQDFCMGTDVGKKNALNIACANEKKWE